ncbi:hypothetical protein [Paraconexibacter sp.]|uniref:hypothetical protein n=1 Tax=Paraconexibacter sp. TaxID=2949640 RepID=UPI003567D4DA
MGLRDLTSSLTGRRPTKKQRAAGARPGAPRTILPGIEDDELTRRAQALGPPRGATAPAGPLDVSRIDAARERLRREIDPVRDDELDS